MARRYFCWMDASQRSVTQINVADADIQFCWLPHFLNVSSECTLNAFCALCTIYHFSISSVFFHRFRSPPGMCPDKRLRRQKYDSTSTWNSSPGRLDAFSSMQWESELCCQQKHIGKLATKKKQNKRFKFLQTKLRRLSGIFSFVPFRHFHNRHSFRLCETKNVHNNFWEIPLFFSCSPQCSQGMNVQDFSFPIGFHSRLGQIVLFRNSYRNKRRRNERIYGRTFPSADVAHTGYHMSGSLVKFSRETSLLSGQRQPTNGTDMHRVTQFFRNRKCQRFPTLHSLSAAFAVHCSSLSGSVWLLRCKLIRLDLNIYERKVALAHIRIWIPCSVRCHIAMLCSLCRIHYRVLLRLKSCFRRAHGMLAGRVFFCFIFFIRSISIFRDT